MTKKRGALVIVLIVAISALAFASGSGAANEPIDLPAADVAEQGYDFYDKAVQYKDLDLGPIPRPDGELTLGFVCKAFDNEFWAANKDGAEAAAGEFADVGVAINMDVRAAQGENDEQGQLAVMNDMINKGYDGIVLSPISEGNLLPGVEKAITKDIPLVVNNDAFMPQIDVTAGVWHWEGGLLAAEYINELLDGKGRVAIVQGNLKTPPARSRTDAFVQWFEKNNPNVEIVDIQQANWGPYDRQRYHRYLAEEVQRSGCHFLQQRYHGHGRSRSGEIRRAHGPDRHRRYRRYR